ncbi:MAG: hypothetical protein IKD44_01425 [Lentisphaeria bacterium]|nr:hypothetical protein [Lentisphaeria bacterium]
MKRLFFALSLILGTALSGAKPEYTLTIFPLNFEKQKLSICENYPGTMEIFFKGNQKKYASARSRMILDLPQFITLTGVCEWNKLPRNGKLQRVPAKISPSLIKRGNTPFHRYVIDFDPAFNRFINQGWYRTFIVLESAEKSAGKSGRAYWSFESAGDKLSEKSFELKILPPLPSLKQKCKYFNMQLYYSPLRMFPFSSAIQKERNFWDNLARTKHFHSRFASDVESDKKLFANYIPCLTTDQLLTSYDKTTTRLRDDLIARTPPNIDDKGRIKQPRRPDAVALLGKYAPLYEKYLRDFLRHIKKNYPFIKSISDDFEPHPFGFGPDGRERFAKEMKLAKVPTREEILSKYEEQWFKFMIKVHNELLHFRLRIFKEECPGMTYRLVSDNLHADTPHIARWCGVDVSLADKAVDLHNHMPYYAGSRYFDDMAYCMKFFTTPYLPLIDPAERLERFYRQYTAPGITQNIVATAALGGIGIGFWPDNVFPGEYYHAIYQGFKTVSEAEEYYFNGKRCDQEFEIIARNTVSTRLADGKVITFPNFTTYIRYTAHKYKGKYLLTLFNYHKEQPLILEIRQKRPVKGAPFPMLVKVAPSGCVLAGNDFKHERSRLEKEISRYSGKHNFFQSKSLGNKKIFWEADAALRPILRLDDGISSMGIDGCNKCELVSLNTGEGVEFFQKGFAGRVIFSDINQRPLVFTLKDYGFTSSGNPFITAVATVGPYDGANPIPNPLYKMVITRKIKLQKGKVSVTHSFTNPTQKEMFLDLRINSFPASIGERFKAKNIFLNSRYDNSHKESFYLYKAPEGLWDGKIVTISASDEFLKDTVYFTPDSKFKGIFSWKAAHKPLRTVEFVVKEKSLAPGRTAVFTYTISGEGGKK